MQAQLNIDSLAMDVSIIKNSSPVDANCFIFIDSNKTVNGEQILQQSWIPFALLDKKKKFIPAYWITRNIYLKFTLQNSLAPIDTVYFFPGYSFESIDLYRVVSGNRLQHIKDESRDEGFQPLPLLHREKTTFIAKLRFTKRLPSVFCPTIIQKKFLSNFKTIFYTATYDQQIVGYTLSGLLLMMILFNAANFRIGREKEFLFNCCYAICMFLLIFFNTYAQHKSGIFANFFLGYMAFALLIIGMIFYIAFTRKFLETKTQHPLLNKIFYLEERVLLLLLGCYSCIYFFTDFFWVQSFIENGMKVLVMAIGIFYIVIGMKHKNKLFNYLAWGNMILIFFSVISFAIILFPTRGSGIFTSAIIYFELGIVCELIFFLLGLSYKNKIALIEKIKEQEAMKLVAEKQMFEAKLAVLNVQQQERNRISRDMHDDLGAGVTAIRLFSELAKSRLGKDTIPEIEKISSSANELLNNMNAIIWTMNSSNDSFGNMVAYIRSYAIEYFENTGVKCSITIAENLPEFAVNGEIRRNVFLVVKEALNNILKHAKATEVSLVLKKDSKGINFYIQDNGIGIDLDNLRLFGNGLKNMNQRMQKANINFLIENNQGTRIILRHYFTKP